jgi:hypothetical protein
MRGILRATAASVVVLGTLTLAPGAVMAHQETALYALAVVQDVTPSVDGLEIRVAQLTAPVVIATNKTNEALVIDGVDGEPFLRIRNGRVEANLRSPTAYRAADPTGERPLPDGLRPELRPRWTLLARRTTWSWFDPRIGYRQGAHNDWSIPGSLGAQTLTISGGFEAMEGHGHFRTELDGTPEADGIEIRMFDGLVPGMLARNTTDEVLRIPGRQGEPFLEIGPEGVFGNERSPDFYVSGGQTVRRVPALADPTAHPRWKRLSVEPVWSWLEYRARLPASSHHRAQLGTARHTVLSWETPVTLGDVRFEIEGHVEWIPPRIEPAVASSGESFVQRWGRPLLLALIVAALTLVALKLRAPAAHAAGE